MMKKIFLLLVLTTSIFSVFSQTFSDSRVVFPAIWSSLTNENETVEIKSIDLMSDVYKISVLGSTKGLIGRNLYKYDITYTLLNLNDGNKKIVCKIENPQVSAMDSSGNAIRWRNGGINVPATEASYANAIADKLNKSEDEYSAMLNNTLTNPVFLSYIYGTAINNLWLKNFIETYQIVGRDVSLPLIVQLVDESEIEGYAYKVGGFFASPLIKGIPIIIEYYTNDNAAIGYRTNDKIEISGKIKKITQDSLNKFTGLEIIN